LDTDFVFAVAVKKKERAKKKEEISARLVNDVANDAALSAQCTL